MHNAWGAGNIWRVVRNNDAAADHYGASTMAVDDAAALDCVAMPSRASAYGASTSSSSCSGTAPPRKCTG
eukprot:5009776-Prorocentrum_lima.AAC.1